MEEARLPEAFVRRMRGMLKEEWEAFLGCYDKMPCQALRFNSLKKGLDEEKYQDILKDLQIKYDQPVQWVENAFTYGQDARPGKHPYHEMGMYYIQEPSAMVPAMLLDPKPGERVLDLCAAPGGKSTQLAALMKGEGLLVSNEIHPERCKILSQNIERMGIANAIVTNEECETLSARFPLFFHKIQVDAPCSGEGMFRKSPEAMEEWSQEQVEICADRQLMILNEAAKMLMPGGRMVYSTCTFAPEENEGVMDRFLKEHAEFELEKMEMPYFDEGNPAWGSDRPELARTIRLYPHHLKGEGHFVAVLSKKGMIFQETSVGKTAGGKKSRGTALDKQQKELVQDFCSSILNEEMTEFLMEGKLVVFGEQLYRMPEEAPDLKGLKVLRPGLHIGTFKKGRFEPAHALALFLGKGDVQQCLDLKLEAEETPAYFWGETFPTVGGKGYCLVCVEGCSAGWGKIAGGILKNHYPRGLRKNFYSK